MYYYDCENTKGNHQRKVNFRKIWETVTLGYAHRVLRTKACTRRERFPVPASVWGVTPKLLQLRHLPSQEAETPGVLDSGATNLEDSWPSRKAEARFTLVYFHTSWSMIKYLNVEGKSNASNKISIIYHQ